MKSEESKKQPRRSDYEINHVRIQEAFLALLQQLKRKPTQQELADYCELSRDTVSNHMAELNFSTLKTDFRILTDDVILSIYHSAKKGSAQAQKLWLQVIEGWSEKFQYEQDNELTFEDLTKMSDAELMALARGYRSK